MKKLKLLFAICITLILINSCNKNEPNVSPTVPQNIEDLVANENFDWETLQDIEFKISTPFSSVINITSENGAISYHKGYYNSTSPTYDISLNLPKYVEKVIVIQTGYYFSLNV